MRVHVLYFAVVRERIGRDKETIDLPEDADLAAALDHVAHLHPAVAELRGHLQVALNQEMTAPTAKLRDGDEIALIPPVAGGSEGLYRLQKTPLSIDEAVAAVAGQDAGGTVIFCGTVRRKTGHRTTLRLEYEAYAGMAEKTFRRIGEDLSTKHGARLAILHRTGMLELGETAVIIVASAPHRAEAFAACSEAIDRLKRESPIWKKELGEDGSVWVGLGP